MSFLSIKYNLIDNREHVINSSNLFAFKSFLSYKILIKVSILIVFLIVSGCSTPSVKQPSGTRILQPDQADSLGGTFMESSDIRSIASKMTSSLLTTSEIALHDGVVRIAMAPIRNSTRFIIDKDIFMKRMRIDMNKIAKGKILFFSQGIGQKVRRKIMEEQDEDIWDTIIEEVGSSIANSYIVTKATEPLKVAIIPVKNTNLAGLNADSFTALIRAKISEKSAGKIIFLARESSGKIIDQILAESDLRSFGMVESIRNKKIAGVDYFLGGEFIAKSMSLESSKKVIEGKIGISDEDSQSIRAEVSSSEKQTNVAKYLNVMLIDAQNGTVPFEKLTKLSRKMKSGVGKADYLFTGELSALSKAARGGDRSDYIIMSFQLVDPNSNEILWEDAYETKKESSMGILYK